MMKNDNLREHPDLGTLVDYLHRELPEGRDALLLAHLEACAPCRTAYEEQARIGEALRERARADERELPPGVVATIWDAVEREPKGSWWQRMGAALRPVFAVPLVAAIAVAFFFGVPAMHRTPAVTRTVDAASLIDDHAALTSTVPFAESSVAPASLEQDRPSDTQQWIADANAAAGATAH
ncbi:MAG: anti-sigma factor family protein [Vulcanimicrobiaceae bacterium]